MSKRSALITALVALAMLVVPGSALAKSHHKARDRNHDGIPDKWEKKHHLSLKVNQARRDPDHDGLNNKQEFQDNTNPRDADTDNDGLTDGQEVEVGDNPRDADTDNDGDRDGDEISGKVLSFDQGTDNDPSTGTLTIQSADGTVSGAVDSSTRIECKNEGDGEHGDLHASDHGDENSGSGSGDEGDNGGSGSGDEGDNGGSGSGDQAGNCSTADLTPGAVVHEAKLRTASDGTATFTKVELASSSAGTTTTGGND